MVKVGTVGFGETKAFRDYKADLRAYDRNVKTAPQRVEALSKKLKGLKQQQAEYLKTMNNYREQNTRLKSAYEAADPEAKKQEIEAYRRQTEVRMEGAADIIKNGRVTPENVFANTWMKKAACQGRQKDDPEALRNLKEYIVSRTLEEAALKETIDDKEYADSRNERMIEAINNGSGVMQLEKDGLFTEVLQRQGPKLDPEKIYDEYTALYKERQAQRSHPLNRLKEERKALIEGFGKKPVTADCLADIARLNMLDSSIRRAEKLPKNPDEIAKDDRIELGRQLADIHRNVQVKNNMTPAHRKAIEQVGSARQNAGKTFTLEEMANMVNQTAQLNQPRKQPGPQVGL